MSIWLSVSGLNALFVTGIQSHYTATSLCCSMQRNKQLRRPNYGYEVVGVAVAVAVAVRVGVNVIVGGWALSLVICGAIHKA